MVDVSDSKGGAVLVNVQPISSSSAVAASKSNPQESWAIVDEDPPVKVGLGL